MSTNREYVVLVDEHGSERGVADKSVVHSVDTPLHLAFSCHVRDESGRVLVTRRALAKLTWPGVWTNSFCGHPAPGEAMEAAISRRAMVELGISVQSITLELPDFRYRAVDASGIVENEICPVYSATTTDQIRPNPAEVAEWAWIEPDVLQDAVAGAPFAFSPWLGWQLEQWMSPTRAARAEAPVELDVAASKKEVAREPAPCVLSASA